MASETLKRLTGIEARLDLVVIRLDHMVALLERMVIMRAEFDALERRVAHLEAARS